MEQRPQPGHGLMATLYQLVSQKFDRPAESLLPSTTLAELGADAYDPEELRMAYEDLTDRLIMDSFDDVKTLGGLVDVIRHSLRPSFTTLQGA